MEEKRLTDWLSAQRIHDFPLRVHPMAHQEDTEIHQHDFVEIALIEGGMATHCSKEQCQHVKTGDALLIPRGIPHSYCNCSEDFTLINLLFIPESIAMATLDSYLLPGFKLILEQHDASPKQTHCLHVEPEDFRFIDALAQKMARDEQERSPGYQFTMYSKFLVIIGQLARMLNAPTTGKSHGTFNMHPIISYVNAHFKDKLDSAKLCRRFGLSRATLHRNFLMATGTTPLQYQLKLRLGEATTLIRLTDQKLTDIAFELGFTDYNYFGRLFKRYLGMAPRNYRQNNCHTHDTGTDNESNLNP